MNPEERQQLAREILTIRPYPRVSQFRLHQLPYPDRQTTINDLLRRPEIDTDDKLRDVYQQALEFRENNRGRGIRKRRKSKRRTARRITRRITRRTARRKKRRTARRKKRRKSTRNKKRR